MNILKKRDAFKAKVNLIWQDDYLLLEEKCQLTADCFCRLFDLPMVDVILTPAEDLPEVSPGRPSHGLYRPWDSTVLLQSDLPKFVHVLLHELRHHWQWCTNSAVFGDSIYKYDDRPTEIDALAFPARFWSAETLEELEAVCDLSWAA